MGIHHAVRLAHAQIFLFGITYLLKISPRRIFFQQLSKWMLYSSFKMRYKKNKTNKKNKWHSRSEPLMIIPHMMTGIWKGHLNLFKSINQAPQGRKTKGWGKKLSLSCVILISLQWWSGLFLQTRSACGKYNNLFMWLFSLSIIITKSRALFTLTGLYFHVVWMAICSIWSAPWSQVVKVMDEISITHVKAAQRWKSVFMQQRNAFMLASFLHNCCFFWTLLAFYLGKDLCRIHCWVLCSFYFFVDYQKPGLFHLKESTSRTSSADPRDPVPWIINTITFITSSSWLYCSISSSIWVQSPKA